MPFPINDPRLTQPMVLAYGLKGRAGFSLDEIVVPVAITQDLSTSPYAVLPRRFALFNSAIARAARLSLLEVRVQSENVVAEITGVQVNASNMPLELHMSGTTDQLLVNEQQVAFAIDLASGEGATAGDPIVAEMGLLAGDVAVGVNGGRFAAVADPLNIDYYLAFNPPIILRFVGPRLWIIGQTGNVAMPLCSVFGRLWEARG